MNEENMIKNILVENEIKRYRKRLHTELFLEMLVVLLIIIFIGLGLFYGGMMYERTRDGSNGSVANSNVCYDIPTGKNLY